MSQYLGIDLYQLKTLVAHAAAGRLDHSCCMSFFFRRMPKHRNYVVAAGMRHALRFARNLGLSPEDLDDLHRLPELAPVWGTEAGREVYSKLIELRGFAGDIDALREGTLAFAGPAKDQRGSPVTVLGVPLVGYTPLMQVRTDMVRAKLLETPWLSRINYCSMVASKAARIVSASREDGVPRQVLEFGQRRMHAEAAVDAAYAAYLAGCDGTSNVRAGVRHGIPVRGTMDHFAVQASERPGMGVADTELDFFRRFRDLFPHAATLLVDTYTTSRGIENAVRAGCTGIRIDSNVTPDTIRQARILLDSLGARDVKIIVSDGLDEWRVRDLARAGADGFGVGENITCSPDAAAGIGAVGKLVKNGYGKLTMKLSRGSGKATLPGMLQCYRFEDHDLLTLAEEPEPPGGKALLEPVWRGKDPAGPLAPLKECREEVRSQIEKLPPRLRALEPDPHGWSIVVSDALLDAVRRLAAEAA